MSIKHKNTNKTKRPYRRITSTVIAKHKAQMLISGNSSRAVEDTDDDYARPRQRAYMIMTKGDSVAVPDMIENGLQQIATEAIQTLANSVLSTDEAIALRSSMYIIDHLRGKAVQRSESKNLNISIESVL